MMPLPMNEIIQQQVKPIGFDLDFDVVDWGTMLVVKRSAPTAPASHGADALNNSLGFADPASMFRYFSATSFSPNGINWGHYSQPQVQDLLNQAQESFDFEQQTELSAKAHAIVVDDLDAHPVGGIASLVGVLICAHILGVGEARVFRRLLGAGTGRQTLHRPVNATIEKERNGITLLS